MEEVRKKWEAGMVDLRETEKEKRENAFRQGWFFFSLLSSSGPPLLPQLGKDQDTVHIWVCTYLQHNPQRRPGFALGRVSEDTQNVAFLPVISPSLVHK